MTLKSIIDMVSSELRDLRPNDNDEEEYKDMGLVLPSAEGIGLRKSLNRLQEMHEEGKGGLEEPSASVGSDCDVGTERH